MLRRIFKLRPEIVEEKLGPRIHLGTPWLILLLPLTFVIMCVSVTLKKFLSLLKHFKE